MGTAGAPSALGGSSGAAQPPEPPHSPSPSCGGAAEPSSLHTGPSPVRPAVGPCLPWNSRLIVCGLGPPLAHGAALVGLSQRPAPAG